MVNFLEIWRVLLVRGLNKSTSERVDLVSICLCYLILELSVVSLNCLMLLDALLIVFNPLWTDFCCNEDVIGCVPLCY